MPTVYLIGITDNDGCPSNRDLRQIKTLRDLNINFVYNFKPYGMEPFKYINFKLNRDGNIKKIDNNSSEYFTIPIAYRFYERIKYWYENTNEEYALFCENDVNFEIAKYWSFTFQELINKLPEKWNYVQLTKILENFPIQQEFKIAFENKHWHYWGNQAILIRRNYAKELIKSFITDNNIIFEHTWNDAPGPASELIIQKNVEGAYTFPIFNECLDSEGNNSYNWKLVCSFLHIQRFWKNNTKKLDEFFNEKNYS